jgi:CBS domain-containing protein
VKDVARDTGGRAARVMHRSPCEPGASLRHDVEDTVNLKSLKKSDTLRVEHHMTRRPRCVTPDLSLEEARRVLGELGVGHAPVLDAGAVVGALSSAALWDAGAHGAARVKDVMERDPFVISPATSVDELSRLMVEEGRRCALVVEGDELVGIFTTRDARGALAKLGIPCPSRHAPTSDRWGHVIAPAAPHVADAATGER